jgi:energy-coupling factor transporter ATP-binding protein EcfA2
VDDDAGIDPELLAEAGEPEQHDAVKKVGFSSGERQLKSLQEIVRFTDASIYLLDEWDANLDPKNRAAANALVEKLASHARVIEISHRDAA